MKHVPYLLPVLLFLAACTGLAPVDLSGWVAEGAGDWELQSLAAKNDTAFQNANTDPGVFYDPAGNAQGRALAGTIRVDDGGDDDFIGFVLGYRPGDIGSEAADYILIDWKRADQDYGELGMARAGLAISRVRGPLREAPGPWAHDPGDGVTELARAATLGATGWEPGRDYAFQIEFTATAVRVRIDGQPEIDITGQFADGAFGFYNYSQPQVRYAGIQTARVLPLPEWVIWLSLSLLLAAAVAAYLRRRLASRA